MDLSPDVLLPQGYSNRMLFNLLQLASAVSYGTILNPPIDRLFQRRALQGEYFQPRSEIHDLREVLRDAMIYNQDDNKWQKDWETMLRGERHDFLPGGVEAGFLGLITMPDPKMQDAGGPGPYLDACGDAFKSLAAFYGSRSNRVNDFAGSIVRYTEYWGTRPSTQSELLTQSASKQWPNWTGRSMKLAFGNSTRSYAN